MDTVDLLEVIKISHIAGQKILAVYDSAFVVKAKEDKSPLTEADVQSNEAVASHLDRLYPDIPMLSEEEKSQPFCVRDKWEYFWLVDPLDGTKEFVKKTGEFTVNIALIHRGEPVLGVVYAPVLDVFYYSQLGLGSYKYDHKASNVQSFSSLPEILNLSSGLTCAHNGDKTEKITVVGSVSHMSPETDEFVRRIKSVREVQLLTVGSSLKFCMVAEGLADIYPRFGPTMEWDTAAGHAILNMAGGVVVRVSDNIPLAYNKEHLLNPWFIASSQRPDRSVFDWTKLSL